MYESGSPLNRYAFEITDDFGNYVSSKSVVTGAVLKDPSENPVNISSLEFEPLYDYYGSRFDLGSSAWIYYTPIPISDFGATILGSLVIGTYTLEVSMENGQTLTQEIDFDFLLDLPIVSSRTYQIHTDSTGNLHCT